MGCGPAQPEAPSSQKPVAPEGLSIYGDWFNSDTRALVAICEHAGIKHTFELVDTLARKNIEPEYKSLNPSGSIPILTSGVSRVISEGPPLYDWILNTEDAAKKLFHHPEQERDVAAIQRYFFREVRANTSQLIRRQATKVLAPERAPKPDDQNAQNRLKEFMFVFLDNLLKQLNAELEKYKYMTGPELSILDIILYCEIF